MPPCESFGAGTVMSTAESWMLAVSAFLPSAPFSQLSQAFSMSVFGAPGCERAPRPTPPSGATIESSVASSSSGKPLHGFGLAACARPGASPDTASADSAASLPRRRVEMDTCPPLERFLDRPNGADPSNLRRGPLAQLGDRLVGARREERADDL